MGKNKVKYYVVWIGQKPGVYKTWNECKLQIAGYPNAKYKSFPTLEEAKEAYTQAATDHIGQKKKETSTDFIKFKDEIIVKSISVDAACSGNPGLMEYRGVVTNTKKELFRMGPFKNGTNNVGEFLALVHAMAFLKQKEKTDIPIYSDSRTAMAWVRHKKLKSTLKQDSQNKEIFVLIERALAWLHKNTTTYEILKWETERWGEIPADFGRK